MISVFKPIFPRVFRSDSIVFLRENFAITSKNIMYTVVNDIKRWFAVFSALFITGKFLQFVIKF